jgi:hypothetical protein
MIGRRLDIARLIALVADFGLMVLIVVFDVVAICFN